MWLVLLKFILHLLCLFSKKWLDVFGPTFCLQVSYIWRSCFHWFYETRVLELQPLVAAFSALVRDMKRTRASLGQGNLLSHPLPHVPGGHFWDVPPWRLIQWPAASCLLYNLYFPISNKRLSVCSSIFFLRGNGSEVPLIFAGGWEEGDLLH
jgi:hypothetical protein